MRRPRPAARPTRPALVATAVVTALVVVLLAIALLAGSRPPESVRTGERPTPSAAPLTVANPTTVPTAPPTTAATAPPTTARVPVAGEIATLRIADPQPDGYTRAEFGNGWIDADGDCQDTRAEVLALQSRVPVSYTAVASCTVLAGEWVDPWSGAVSTSARALDVDHTVPLANAWRSGARAWTREQRIAFANDLSDAGHLLAIPLGENRSKGDDGPEAWRPPLATSWCAYAQLWTSIKARWDLSASPAEWAALQQMAATC
ncbi:MAG: HNH endonuclease family protein [Actinomycetota bacterium]